MFRRLKNLWALSNYTVDELKKQEQPGVFYSTPDFPINSPGFSPAKIINLQTQHPFDAYETTEQSPDDTTPRNG